MNFMNLTGEDLSVRVCMGATIGVCIVRNEIREGALKMKRPKCIYIFQFDEVRPDHLSVYGYHRRQKNIEELAKEGVVFRTNIAGSSYTGAATPVLWSGMKGPHTGVRDPFSYICPPLLQEYLRKMGFVTQGCMSQSVAGSGIGMNNGFDTWVEPTDPNAPDTWGDGVEHWEALGVHVDARFHREACGQALRRRKP